MRSTRSRLITFAVLIAAIVTSACGELGDQPPKTEALMLTPDGKKVVRLYSVFTVVSYSSQGGSTRRSGSTTSYLEEYDAGTGELISKSPFKFDDNCKLLTVTPTQAWMTTLNREQGGFDILVVDLASHTKVFDSADLASRNGGLKFKTNYVYADAKGTGGVMLEADDARTYSIDPGTGIATVVPKENGAKQISKTVLQMHSLKMPERRYSFSPGTRSSLLATAADRRSGLPDLTSETDFIRPYIAGKFDTRTLEDAPVSIENDLVIVSRSRDSDPFDLQLAAIDRDTLKTKWSATLKNTDKTLKDSDLLDIRKLDQGILVVTKSSLCMLNPANGELIWNKSFVAPEDLISEQK